MQLKAKIGNKLKEYLLEQQRHCIFPSKKGSNYPLWVIREKNKILAKECVSLKEGLIRLY